MADANHLMRAALESEGVRLRPAFPLISDHGAPADHLRNEPEGMD
jgi:hypothetical protein